MRPMLGMLFLGLAPENVVAAKMTLFVCFPVLFWLHLCFVSVCAHMLASRFLSGAVMAQ